jgi:hypothetical protein
MAEPTKIQEYAKPSDFGLAEFKIRTWHLELSENQTFQDALQPQFWKHVCPQIMGHTEAAPKGRGDRIELTKPDTGEAWKLLITEIGKGFVRVRPFGDRSESVHIDIPTDAPLKPRWNVGTRTFDIVRNDGQVMIKGLQTKETALAWIVDHLKSLAA